MKAQNAELEVIRALAIHGTLNWGQLLKITKLSKGGLSGGMRRAYHKKLVIVENHPIKLNTKSYSLSKDFVCPVCNSRICSDTQTKETE